MSEYLTQAYRDSSEAVVFFCCIILKVELGFVDGECQQFILMQNSLSVSYLGAAS